MKTTPFILLYVALGALGQLALRMGARSLGAATDRGASAAFFAAALGNPWILTGLAAWVLSTAVWMLVLARTEVSYAYGLSALGYIVVPVLSYLALKEPLPPLRLLGMALVAAGVVCVFLSKGVARAP